MNGTPLISDKIMATKKLMNVSEFAEHLGVSRPTVYEWKAKGWLVFDGRKVDVLPSKEILREKRLTGTGQPIRSDITRKPTDRPPKKPTATRKDDPFSWLDEPPKRARTPAKKTPADEPDIEEERLPEETDEEFAARMLASGKATLSYQAARQMRENYEALLKKLKYDEEIGTLVPVQVVAAMVGEQYAKIRTRILAIPAEQAPRVHRCKTPAQVQDALTQILTDILEELSSDGLPS